MESLINQSRVRFSDAKQGGTEEAAASIGGRRIQPQRTQSFKGEKSKTQNWFQRQFSGTMSKDYDTSDGGDYTAAVAAAAYAINSLYDDATPTKKLPQFEMPDASSTKFRSKTEDASREPARRSKSLSGKKEDMSTKIQEPATARRSKKSLSDDDTSGSESSDEKFTSLRKFFGDSSGKAPPMKKKISFANDLMNPKGEKEAEAAIATKPSFKKRPSFTDDKPSFNKMDSIEAQIPETAGLKPGNGFPKPDPRSTILPLPPPKTRVQGSRADVWERTQMARITKRYEKLRSTIDSWESKKREKAKRQKEKREGELEQKRARVLQHFRREIESIDAVARGARAEAEKKKFKEELKVKEKAKRIRTTGKLPTTCFCF